MLPLSRNADLSPKAKDLAAELRRGWNVDFDDAGAIGKRYRRQDEVGTPYCVTVDFETLDDHAVTVRERDTMAQERVSLDRHHGLLRRAIRRLLSRPRACTLIACRSACAISRALGLGCWPSRSCATAAVSGAAATRRTPRHDAARRAPSGVGERLAVPPGARRRRR